MSRRRPSPRVPGHAPRVPGNHKGAGPHVSGGTRFFLKPWVGVCLLISCGTFWCHNASYSAIAQAERALGRGDFREALRLALQDLQMEPKSDRALLLAGSASLALQSFSSARSYFERVSEHDPCSISLARRELGRMALNSGQASRAEELLRTSLAVGPSDSLTRDQLIYLLTLQGRNWEARALILEQLRAGVVTTNYLVVAGKQNLSLEAATSYARHCLGSVPDDPLPRLALAQQAWRDNQSQTAREQLELVLEKHPDLVEAHALLCQVIAETGTPGEFEREWDRLPLAAQGHPDVWLSRGRWAESQEQTAPAARCYWEALRLEPNLTNASYRLSQALMKLGLADQALPFAERARQLTKVSLEMSSLTSKLDVEKLPAIISQLETLGRDWEATAWCQMVLQGTGRQPDWARATQLRLHQSLGICVSYTAPSHDPSRNLDLSHYPLPVSREANSSRSSPVPAQPQSAQITFQDDATQSGVVFTYHNGAASGHLESMLEMNGGGVAVLDYDGDHWPDIFFTQGGSLPPAPFDPATSDQLFRNCGAHWNASPDAATFVNVTEAAGLHDIGYGQGVTVGDFDNDGFPDLYVGNIGANQLYHNNGDGTFSDVTANSETQAGGWTSSCVFADLNQDGLPDLYVVTYLGGEAPYRSCDKRVRPRCSPLDYPAEADRCYLNLGDGRFRDLTASNGLAAAEGRGLGVVAADFDGSGKLSLFVANDMSANFFFHNQTTGPADLRFEERGLLSGLAFDHLGQSKACMGVAAGDYNRDSRLDLFVTNFYRQANDLYTQQADGSFRDLSREAGLFEPSFLMLGWGTQFLDGDLDGNPDLVVTNGHVHDPLDSQIPYRMPAQFFRNRGDGSFAEILAPELGDFFQRKMLGRSLARLDWNRDGREDACISHLNDPAALLTNRTDEAGSFLSLRLIAVDSARDAIGTRVQVSIGDITWVRQLTAGDGFQASNERRLVFGLGSHTTADSVEVLWPSGLRQKFSNLNLNREWVLIENRAPLQMTTAFTNGN